MESPQVLFIQIGCLISVQSAVVWVKSRSRWDFISTQTCRQKGSYLEANSLLVWLVFSLHYTPEARHHHHQEGPSLHLYYSRRNVCGVWSTLTVMSQRCPKDVNG